MTNIIPSEVSDKFKLGYNPRKLPGYVCGREAYLRGETRDDCPHPIRSSVSESADRVAWMMGHLDEEFKKYDRIKD